MQIPFTPTLTCVQEEIEDCEYKLFVQLLSTNWVERKRNPYILVILAKVLHTFPNNIQNSG